MTVDEFIVMAQRDRHPPYLTGGPRELGRHTDSFDLFPQLLVLPLNVDIACLIMGILGHVLGRHDGRTGHLNGIHRLHDLLNRALLYPAAQDSVEFYPRNGVAIYCLTPFIICWVKTQDAAYAVLHRSYGYDGNQTILS